MTMDHQPTYTMSFAYDEIRPDTYSLGQGFLGKLFKGATKVISGVVKGVSHAIPVVSKLAGKLLPALMPALEPVLGKKGASLVGQLAGILGGSGGKITDVLKDPAKVAQIAKLLKTTGLTQKLAHAKGEPVEAMGHSYGFSQGYGAMAPTYGEYGYPDEEYQHPERILTQLLEHSLHPETLQGLMVDTLRPAVMRGMVVHGLIDTFKLIPGFPDALERMVTEESWSTGQPPAIAGLASHSPEYPYHRVEAVTLHFTDIEPLSVGGRSRVLYYIGDDLAFPLELETPRPIRHGTLQILVKCPETLKVMVEQTFQLHHLVSGELDTVPYLSRSQLRSLQPNAEYLICAVLTWTARSSQSGHERRLGTSTSVLATLMGNYIFDQLDGVTETFALNDPQTHRPYWHKVWTGGMATDDQTLALDCKYYYVLEAEPSQHARMETLIRMDAHGGDASGKLKTGLVLSLTQLNQLAAWMFEQPPLDTDEIAALSCCEFCDRFHQLARTQVTFTGDAGDRATLWVYPEFDQQQVVLKQVSDRDANGRVQQLVDHIIQFPIPTTAHFVGTTTAV